MQTGVFSKRSYEKAKGSLHFIFTSFDTHFSKLLSSYILSRFRIFFYFLHPFKESNVSSFVDTVNFNIFQKVIASRVHLYIFSGCENCLLKKPFILYVILKAFFWPAKIELAIKENVSSALKFTISPFLIHSANIASKSNILMSLTAHFSAILPPLLNRYTQDNNVHIWARGPAKPPCRLFNIYADMYKYQVLSINERREAPKPDMKTLKNQQVEKTRGTCTPDQGSGATLGVLGYASA